MQRFARSLMIVVVLALAIDLFAGLPAQAAGDALHAGTWDLARYFAGAVVTRAQAPSDSLPLLLGAIVLLAAMSSSGKRRRDRW